jgi:DNA helicase-2/ATP-dependent DNA helicase PcrA
MTILAPTAEQQAIFDYCADLALPASASPSLFLNAGAGCGKSSTIVAASAYFADNPRQTLFLAFNKAIADDLSTKLPDGVPASTFHSLCLRALTKVLPKRPQIDKFKTRAIAKSVIPEDEFEHYKQYVPRLVSYAKNAGVLTLMDNEIPALQGLAEHHSLEGDTLKTDPYLGAKYAKEIITRSYKSLEVIDFDDMLWLPFVRGTPMPQFQFVFTDESQDFNAVQLKLLGRITPDYGKLIAVGDPHQAIYGFRGAMADSTVRMIERFDMNTLPLSVSFRCAKRIIEVAQEFNPSIQARPDAPEGRVNDLGDDWSLDSFAPGDAILCRTNAPIVRLAFQLLSARKQCYIEGREYGEQMISLVKKINPMRIEDLPQLLERYSASQRESLMLQDKIAAINALLPGCHNVGDLLNLIDTMFTKRPSSIVLSSVHKSKGLEWNRVWIFRYHSLMPHPKSVESGSDLTQEYNLKYVAVTRARTELNFIEPISEQE